MPKIRKKREKTGTIGKKEENSGTKGKNREGSFTLPFLTEWAGYATGLIQFQTGSERAVNCKSR